MSLENAEPEVKLAVDLILLLENHAIEPDVVLAALEIVRRDYLHKAQMPKPILPSSPTETGDERQE